MERGAARLCRGLTPSGAGRLESAREKMERGWMFCARGWMWERGASHFGATGALSAKSGACACVSVRVCARV